MFGLQLMELLEKDRKHGFVGGGMALGWVLRFQRPIPFPVSFLCTWLRYELLVITPAQCLPAAMFPTMMVMDSFPLN